MRAGAGGGVRTVAARFQQEGHTDMASGAKKKTTFAKLAREQKLRERRLDKQARKEARKGATDTGPQPFRDGQPAGGGVGPAAE